MLARVKPTNRAHFVLSILLQKRALSMCKLYACLVALKVVGAVVQRPLPSVTLRPIHCDEDVSVCASATQVTGLDNDLQSNRVSALQIGREA